MRDNMHTRRSAVLNAQSIVVFTMDNSQINCSVKYQKGTGKSVNYMHATVRNVKRVNEFVLQTGFLQGSFRNDVEYTEQKIIAPLDLPCFSDDIRIDEITTFGLLSGVSDVSGSHGFVDSYLLLLNKCTGLKMIRQVVSTNFDIRQVASIAVMEDGPKVLRMFARLSRPGILMSALNFQKNIVNLYNPYAKEKSDLMMLPISTRDD